MHTFTKVGLDALLTPENASGTILAWELANEAMRA